jgi:hypothetical protein
LLRLVSSPLQNPQTKWDLSPPWNCYTTPTPPCSFLPSFLPSAYSFGIQELLLTTDHRSSERTTTSCSRTSSWWLPKLRKNNNFVFKDFKLMTTKAPIIQHASQTTQNSVKRRERERERERERGAHTHNRWRGAQRDGECEGANQSWTGREWTRWYPVLNWSRE